MTKEKIEARILLACFILLQIHMVWMDLFLWDASFSLDWSKFGDCKHLARLRHREDL